MAAKNMGQKTKSGLAPLARPGFSLLQGGWQTSPVVQRLDHPEHNGADERKRGVRGNDVELGGEIHGNCSRFRRDALIPQVLDLRPQPLKVPKTEPAQKSGLLSIHG